MAKIRIENNPDALQLQKLGVSNWPVWEKEISEFPWTYDEEETCYFLAGDVVVTTEEGNRVTMGKGDLVTFSKGLTCKWKILKDVKKHYKFGSEM